MFYVAASCLMLNYFKLLFSTLIYTPYTIKYLSKNIYIYIYIKNKKLPLHKWCYIPLHKYSYPYLGQLEFSSGAFILLVGVTRLWVKVTCGKFNWMGMIWKGTHVLIKGPTADNAYQSKNQVLGSKEQSVELRNRFASSHIWGQFRIKFLLHWRVTEACSLCYP